MIKNISLPFSFHLIFNENTDGNVIWLMAYYDASSEVSKDETLDHIEEFKKSISSSVNKKVLYTFKEDEFKSLKKNKNEFTKFIFSLQTFESLMKKLGIKKLMKSEAIYLIDHIKVEKVNYGNNNMAKFIDSMKDINLDSLVENESYTLNDLLLTEKEIDNNALFDALVPDNYFDNDIDSTH